MRTKLYLCLLLLLWSLPASATIRYVDKDDGACSDSGSGTSSVPYCTLTKALETTPPACGDTVRIRNASTSYAEDILVTTPSCSSGSPITIEPDTGHTPTITFASGVANQAKGYWEIRDVDYWTIQNLTFDGQSNSANAPRFALFIKALTRDVVGILLVGNTFQNHAAITTDSPQALTISGTGVSPGVRVTATVRSNTLTGNRGISIAIAANLNSLFELNEISNFKCGEVTSAVARAQGIKERTAGGSPIIVESSGTILRRNRVHDSQSGNDCLADYPNPPFTSVDIQGIYCDAGPANGLWEYNYVYNIAQVATSMAGANIRSIWTESRCDNYVVQHNVSAHTRGSGLRVGNNADNATFRNNTVYDHRHFGVDYIDGTPSNITNNIMQSSVIASNSSIRINTAAQPDAYTINFNDWWPVIGTIGNWTGVGTFSTIAAWRTQCNCDANSINADPLLIDPNNANPLLADFTLGVGSPAINAGTGTPFLGSAKDMGAFESPLPSGNCTTTTATQWDCPWNALWTPIISVCALITPERTAPSSATGTASNCVIVNNTTARFDVSGFTPVNGDTLRVTYATGAIKDGILVGNTLRASSLATTQNVTNTIQTTAPGFFSCAVDAGQATTLKVVFDSAGQGPMQPATGCTGLTARRDTVNWPVSSCARFGTTTRMDLTMTTSAVAGEAIDVSYSQATGNITNNVGIESSNFTNQACTNNLAATPPTFSSGQVTNAQRNNVVLTFNAGGSTPMLPATGCTGFTCRTDTDATPDNWPIASCSRTADEEFTLVMTTDATAGDGLDCSYDQGPGNVTNQASTELTAFTNQAIINNVQSETFTVTQAHCRCAYPHRVETDTRWHAAEDAACRVMPTGKIAVVCQLQCTGANCPERGYTWFASDNGGTIYQVADTFGAMWLRYTEDLVLQHLASTTRQLTTCTHTAGKVYEAPSSISTLAIANGNCSEWRGVFEVSSTATIGQSLTVGLQGDNGTGVTQSVTQTIQVIEAFGGF